MPDLTPWSSETLAGHFLQRSSVSPDCARQVGSFHRQQTCGDSWSIFKTIDGTEAESLTCPSTFHHPRDPVADASGAFLPFLQYFVGKIGFFSETGGTNNTGREKQHLNTTVPAGDRGVHVGLTCAAWRWRLWF